MTGFSIFLFYLLLTRIYNFCKINLTQLAFWKLETNCVTRPSLHGGPLRPAWCSGTRHRNPGTRISITSVVHPDPEDPFYCIKDMKKFWNVRKTNQFFSRDIEFCVCYYFHFKHASIRIRKFSKSKKVSLLKKMQRPQNCLGMIRIRIRTSDLRIRIQTKYLRIRNNGRHIQ